MTAYLLHVGNVDGHLGGGSITLNRRQCCPSSTKKLRLLELTDLLLIESQEQNPLSVFREREMDLTEEDYCSVFKTGLATLTVERTWTDLEVLTCKYMLHTHTNSISVGTALIFK